MFETPGLRGWAWSFSLQPVCAQGVCPCSLLWQHFPGCPRGGPLVLSTLLAHLMVLWVSDSLRKHCHSSGPQWGQLRQRWQLSLSRSSLPALLCHRSHPAPLRGWGPWAVSSAPHLAVCSTEFLLMESLSLDCTDHSEFPGQLA